MKKIKITVAALLLGGMSYAQQVDFTHAYIDDVARSNTFKAQWAHTESVNTIEDMVEWMRWDIKTGAVEPEVGQSYVESLMSLLSKLEDINAGLITAPFVCCENCDEIE